MIASYYRTTYILQIAAVLLVWLALFLPWHTDDTLQTGFEIVQEAPRMPLGLMIYNAEGEIVVSVSPWWMMLAIPIVSFVFGLRAINGLIFTQIRGPLWLTIFAGLWFMGAFGWFFEYGFDGLRIGFWSAFVSATTLVLAVGLEYSLPSLDEDLFYPPYR